jgi:hypothetical protein
MGQAFKPKWIQSQSKLRLKIAILGSERTFLRRKPAIVLAIPRSLPAVKDLPIERRAKISEMMSLPPKNIKLVLNMRKATPRDRTNFVAKGRFQFMTEAFIRENYIQFTPFQSSHLRKILPKGIAWVQIVKGGIVHWN